MSFNFQLKQKLCAVISEGETVLYPEALRHLIRKLNFGLVSLSVDEKTDCIRKKHQKNRYSHNLSKESFVVEIEYLKRFLCFDWLSSIQ